MITELIKPHIRKIAPYQSARDLYAKATGILLDANENPIGSVLGGEFAALHLNRYPDPRQRALRASLSAYLAVPEEQLFFGVGSDEIIDLLMRLFCSSGEDSILIVEPTYGMYQTVADIQNIASHTCLLNEDFSLDAERVLASVQNTDKVIFVCSPNNPTGNLLSKSAIKQIAEGFNGILVVDEAYIDFAPEDASAVSLLADFANVMVLRTFSKAWGMAAARCGYCIAHPEIISYLFKIKAPYSINAFTEQAILSALQKVSVKNTYVSEIVQEREKLLDALAGLSFIRKVFPTDANYILIRLPNARKIQKALMEAGVIIRDRSSQPLLADCLRITVGTREENAALLEKLAAVAEGFARQETEIKTA
jgi:histidinol-phosphate aminotransferase